MERIKKGERGRLFMLILFLLTCANLFFQNKRSAQIRAKHVFERSFTANHLTMLGLFGVRLSTRRAQKRKRKEIGKKNKGEKEEKGITPLNIDTLILVFLWFNTIETKLNYHSKYI